MIKSKYLVINSNFIFLSNQSNILHHYHIVFLITIFVKYYVYFKIIQKLFKNFHIY